MQYPLCTVFRSARHVCKRFHSCAGTASSSGPGSFNANLNYKEITIPTPWGHIAAKEWGNSNGRPLLGIHGWQDNSNSFDLVAPHLPKDLRFVAIDLPGHGLSSWIRSGDLYDNFFFVQAIERVRRHLEWTSFSILAHSLGAVPSVWYASSFPNNIRKFVSLDVIKPLMVHPLSGAILAKRVVQLIHYDLNGSSPPSYTMDELVERLLKATKDFMTEASARIMLSRGTIPLGDSRYVLNRDKRLTFIIPVDVSASQMKSFIRNLKCDVLIIAASNGNSYANLTSPQARDEFIENYRANTRSFKLVDIEGTHHVHLNNPERVIPILQEYLKD